MSENIIMLILCFIGIIVSVYFGFWMGRHTVERPLAPVIKSDGKPVELGKDPFSEAMEPTEL